jgi:hypothetical protein
MPRQSRSSRPAARPAAASSAPSGSRGAHTAAYPSQQQHHAPAPAAAHPQTQQRQPGMLAQAASTMGGAMGELAERVVREGVAG